MYQGSFDTVAVVFQVGIVEEAPLAAFEGEAAAAEKLAHGEDEGTQLAEEESMEGVPANVASSELAAQWVVAENDGVLV